MQYAHIIASLYALAIAAYITLAPVFTPASRAANAVEFTLLASVCAAFLLALPTAI